MGLKKAVAGAVLALATSAAALAVAGAPVPPTERDDHRVP